MLFRRKTKKDDVVLDKEDEAEEESDEVKEEEKEEVDKKYKLEGGEPNTEPGIEKRTLVCSTCFLHKTSKNLPNTVWKYESASEHDIVYAFVVLIIV